MTRRTLEETIGDWFSRLTAAFFGGLAALIIFAVMARVYVQWEISRVSDNIDKALKKAGNK